MRRWHWQYVSLDLLCRLLESIDSRAAAGHTEIVSVTPCRLWFVRKAFVVWWEEQRIVK